MLWWFLPLLLSRLPCCIHTQNKHTRSHGAPGPSAGYPGPPAETGSHPGPSLAPAPAWASRRGPLRRPRWWIMVYIRFWFLQFYVFPGSFPRVVLFFVFSSLSCLPSFFFLLSAPPCVPPSYRVFLFFPFLSRLLFIFVCCCGMGVPFAYRRETQTGTRPGVTPCRVRGRV